MQGLFDRYKVGNYNTRAQWWLISVLNFFILLAVCVLIGFAAPLLYMSSAMKLIVIVLWGLLQLPNCINRLQDAGFSPYLVILAFIPVASLSLIYFCGIAPSRN